MKSIKKKDFKYRNVSPLKSIIMHMYLGLGLGPFCMKYGLDAISFHLYMRKYYSVCISI